MSESLSSKRLMLYFAWASIPDEERDGRFLVVDGKPHILTKVDSSVANENVWSEMFQSAGFNTETGEYVRAKTPEEIKLSEYPKHPCAS